MKKRQAIILLFGFLTGLNLTANASSKESIENVSSSGLAITKGATISGKYFFDQNGHRLLLRGVGFQPVNGTDPLVDTISRQPNVAIQALLNPANAYSFKNLNINAIRVYQVSHDKSHAKTMALLANNGIYVIVGLANTAYGTNIPQKPVNNQHAYPSQFKARVQQIIDEFHVYPNVLSFEVANEVTDPGVEGMGTILQKNAASAVKAAANDAKSYMATKGYRAIPVGVAMQDTPVNESTVAQYYESAACNGAPLDYIGINSYRYVPPKGNAIAYEGLVSDYNLNNYAIPVILSEYENGLTAGNRDFLDVRSFYDDSLILGNISGGFAYQYIGNGSGAGSGFALVKLGSGSSGLNSKTDVKNLHTAWPNAAFKNLAAQYKTMQENAPYVSPLSPGVLACPITFNPPLCVVGTMNCSGSIPGTITVSVQDTLSNSYPMVLVQNSSVIDPPLPINDGKKYSVKIDPTQQLLLQQKGSWNTICTVAANTLLENNLISAPAAEWGGSCTVAQK